MRSHTARAVAGRSQHVTLGAEFLTAPTGSEQRGISFSSNCDRGMTWPDPELPPSSQWATAAEFTYPDVPRKDGLSDDWRQYPRTDVNSDLLTMRVSPDSPHGWFVAERGAADAPRLALACATPAPPSPHLHWSCSCTWSSESTGVAAGRRCVGATDFPLAHDLVRPHVFTRSHRLTCSSS